ncbi:hypothetical protein HDU76_003608 [Blyttiomyces sp. JEL0837]|nr:hypothetical protein HDU76_003608 [Blyttiomyces sp. JEL0837]
MQQQVTKLDLHGVETELAHLTASFEQKETEETWTAMDDALNRFIAVVKGSATVPGFVQAARKLKQPVLISLASERTRLARTGMLLVEVLARSLGDKFETLSDFTLSALLKLCTRANKVFVTCAANTLKIIIENAGVPSIMPLLHESLHSPSKSLRICAAEMLNLVLEANSPHRLENYVEQVENAIKSGCVDPTPEVRSFAKKTFELYKDIFSFRLDRFVLSLPETAAKYLKVTKQAGSISSQYGSTKKLAPPARQRVALSSLSSRDRATSKEDDETASLESETPSFTHSHTDAEDELSGLSAASRVRPRSLIEVSNAESAHGSLARARPVSFSARTNESSLGGGASNNAGQLTSNTAQGLAARRLLMERPPRMPAPTEISGIGTVTHLTEHAGGAMRVPREEPKQQNHTGLPSSGVPSKSKAQRVPLAAAPAAESHAPVLHRSATLTQIDDHARGGIARPKRRITVATGQPQSASNATRSASSGQSRPLSLSDAGIDLTDIMNKVKSTDWSTRQRALDALNNYISLSTTPSALPTFVAEIRARVPRFLEIYLIGLGDNHNKCLASSIIGLSVLLEMYGSQDMVDAVLPRLAGIVYYNQTKVKPGLVVLGQKLIDIIRDKFGIEVTTLAAIHALHNPEFAKGLRIRAGCLALLAEISDEEFNLIFSKPSTFKVFMTRLLGAAGDTDAGMQKSLKMILGSMHAVMPEAFWSAWGNAKASERKAVNALFGSKDISFDKKELEAARRVSPPMTQTSIKTETSIRIASLKGSPRRSPKSSRNSLNSPNSGKSGEVEEHITEREANSPIGGRPLVFSSPIKGSPAKLRIKIRRTSENLSGLRQRMAEEDLEEVPTSQEKDRRSSDSSDDMNGSSNQGLTRGSGAPYEDSDTDWMTESEVLRSPDGSEIYQRIGMDAMPEKLTPAVSSYQGVAAFASGSFDDIRNLDRKPSSSDMLASDDTTSKTFIEPAAPLGERVGREVLQNMDALKEVDEMLTRLQNAERASQRAAQEKLVESLSRNNHRLSTGSSPSTSVSRTPSGIPMMVSHSSIGPGSANSGTRGPTGSPSPRLMRSGMSPSPSGDVPRVARTSSLPGPSFKSSLPPSGSSVQHSASLSSNGHGSFNQHFATAVSSPITNGNTPSHTSPSSLAALLGNKKMSPSGQPVVVASPVEMHPSLSLPSPGSAGVPMSPHNIVGALTGSSPGHNTGRAPRPLSGNYSSAPATPSNLKNVIEVPESPIVPTPVLDAAAGNPFFFSGHVAAAEGLPVGDKGARQIGFVEGN